jgi:N-hydroxyarylamine O-acetyltransferase
VPDLDVAAYLRRLGVTDPGPPSVAALHRLHRAHVELVPYENLEIQLDRPTSTDPFESAERVVRHRRGGYCFHLNGAFSALLAALGYDVTWHRGGVQGRDEPRPPGATGNHLVLTVRGLPSPECPEGVWFADAGLGDALHDPLPLRPGTYQQGPCTYGLAPSEVVPGGWRFTHDPGGSFAGMDFGPQRATRADFAEMHRIVLGGELGSATDLLLEPLRRGLTDAAMPAAASAVTVSRGELGARAVALGGIVTALRATTPD